VYQPIKNKVMENITIEVVCDNPFTEEYREMIDSLYEDKKRDNFRDVGGWYLDGKLDTDCGYDIAKIKNYKDIPTKETYDWESISKDFAKLRSDKIIKRNYLQGIYPVKVEGIDYPCVGYFGICNKQFIDSKLGEFLRWDQRGLVVAKDDLEANKYALEAFNENRDYL
jgi:hypothetical protein